MAAVTTQWATMPPWLQPRTPAKAKEAAVTRPTTKKSRPLSKPIPPKPERQRKHAAKQEHPSLKRTGYKTERNDRMYAVFLERGWLEVPLDKAQSIKRSFQLRMTRSGVKGKAWLVGEPGKGVTNVILDKDGGQRVNKQLHLERILKEKQTVNDDHKAAGRTTPGTPGALARIPQEADPNGKDPHEPGAKLDAGKVRMSLVYNGFANAILEVGKVGTYGANKYTDNGWRSVPDGVARYTDAMHRHLLAEACGESCDKDTALLHAAHAAWNALARLELIISGA